MGMKQLEGKFSSMITSNMMPRSKAVAAVMMVNLCFCLSG